MRKHTLSDNENGAVIEQNDHQVTPSLKEKSPKKKKKKKLGGNIALHDEVPTRLVKLKNKFYEQELSRLQVKLVKLQYWIKQTGCRLVILFEGRDVAGKGGTIKRISEPLNPRGCQVAALSTPSDREKTQWYFQRYVSHLPSA